jgi:hypothetical protein
MLGTIAIGTCVSVQGEIVARLPDGRISVSVGEQVFTGRAVNHGDMPLRTQKKVEGLRRIA